MSLKLKALSLAVFAALAVGAVSVVSAGADTGGVVHSDVEWTHIKGQKEGTAADNRLFDTTLEDAVTCKISTYTSNVGKKTATEVTVSAEFKECDTESGFPATVKMNGCHFVLTFTDIASATHHTAHLTCPANQSVIVTVNPPIVGECHIHIPPQTPTKGGVFYTNVVHNGKHSPTLDVTVEGITVNRTDTGFGCGGHAGHDNLSDLEATITTESFDTAGNRVNTTVTTAAS